MNDSTSVVVESALVGENYEPSGPVQITIADGLIADIQATTSLADKRLLAMPTLVDAHNHGRPLSTTSFGCGGQPLEIWLPNLALIPSVDVYTAAVASFARSLRGGATSVMVHLTRAMGPMPLPDEAREIARAASDVGISIGLAIAMRDRNPLIYADHEPLLESLGSEQRSLVENTWLRPMMPVEEQLALVDDVANAVDGLPVHIDVQYGPTGVQWCSEELLSAIARASRANGRRVHMHLLETAPQRAWADNAFSGGIVSHLQDIGLLSPRLTLAHCVWARPDELAMIADSGARVAVNASSNLHLFSGIAPVPAMLAAGVEVAMGLDGCALDEDDDGLRELRLMHLLNHARGFDSGGLVPVSALRAACSTGRAGLGLEQGGVLAVGMPADIMLLDLSLIDRDALMKVDPRDYLFARACKEHIDSIFSCGRQVVQNGRVTGVDLPAIEEALREEYRSALKEGNPVADVWPVLSDSIAAHYRGCC